jgi:hypothetical protein
VPAREPGKCRLAETAMTGRPGGNVRAGAHRLRVRPSHKKIALWGAPRTRGDYRYSASERGRSFASAGMSESRPDGVMSCI